MDIVIRLSHSEVDEAIKDYITSQDASFIDKVITVEQGDGGAEVTFTEPIEASSEPEAPKKRKRRTKAEMEAAKAAE